MAKFKKNIPAYIAICVGVVIIGLLLSGNMHDTGSTHSIAVVSAVRDSKLVDPKPIVDKSTSSIVKPIIVPKQSNGLPAHLVDTAAVTMATGDEAGRLAVALMQSLRDSNTQIPNLVVMLCRGGLGSKDCNDPMWKQLNNRPDVNCAGPDTIAEEIISEVYVKALKKLNVQLMIIDRIPDTPYTVIPGGPQTFWGMAFNKLRVFNLTQFRKLLWMDSDTLVLRNLDHVLKRGMFTAALTYDCCNPNGPAKPSGGLWVVEPSNRIMNQLMDTINKPVPGTDNEVWHWGDMQVVKYMFGAPPPLTEAEPYWPSVSDARHGYVPGLKLLPEIAAMSAEQLEAYMNERVQGIKRHHEGFINVTNGTRPEYVWETLDIRYDQCVGMCECLPGRDIPKSYFSIHFSCIHHIGKPSKYETEHDFMYELYHHALSCTRYYYMIWYEKYQKAAGRLPQPHWTQDEIPFYNASHDEYVRAKRITDKV